MWHKPLLFCSVTSQRVVILNAKLCNPSLFVFGSLPLLVVFSSCVLLLCLFKHGCAIPICFFSSVLFGRY